MIALLAVVVVAFLCWFIAWWDRKLDRMEAQQRLARIRERQQYRLNNPRSQE